MTAFCTVADVREYLNVSAPSPDSGAYGSGNIASNIAVASAFLQRVTGRQWEEQAATAKTFTTEGRAFVTIPDLQSATSVTLQGATLTADSTYYLIPDRANSGVYTGIQFRAFGADWRSNPEWFDRNLDTYWQRFNTPWGSLPNDLVITGTWGWATLPIEVWQATRIYAAWLTKRTDAILTNVIQGPEGTISDLSQLPPEVAQFVEEWRLGSLLTGV